MKLNATKDSATLDLSCKFGSAELEELIRKLSHLRTQMTPAVPLKIDEAALEKSALELEDAPCLGMKTLAMGGFRLWLRHSGLGWICYQLDATSAASVATYMSNTPTKENNSPNLFAQDIGNTH